MILQIIPPGIKTIALCIAFMTVVYANESAAETKVEQQFPHNVVIEYNNQELDLILTGLTIRKKFFLKIYSMAHYIEQKADDSASDISSDEIYNNILQLNGARQISMVFMRSLDAEQLQESLVSGIKLNSNEDEYQQILSDVKKFKDAINEDVKQDDEFVLRWFPDGTLVSLFQGQQISAIKNENFARILWSIWFSNKSIVDRKSLIEKLISSS